MVDIFTKPWGGYAFLWKQQQLAVKVMNVVPLSSISVQVHSHRSELWHVLEGRGMLLLRGSVSLLIRGDVVWVPKGAVHSVCNYSSVDCLKILELQSGEFLSEGDIFRYADAYNRASRPAMKTG